MTSRSYNYTPSPAREYGTRYRSPSPRSRSRGHSRDLPTSLLVCNLHRDCRVEDLRKPFVQFGRLKEIYLTRDYYTVEPRGFGFVQYGWLYSSWARTYCCISEENMKKPSEMSRFYPQFFFFQISFCSVGIPSLQCI